MHTADWWSETQVRRNTWAWWRANLRLVNTQSWAYTGSFDNDVRWNASLEFSWRHERLACIYDNWPSFFEAPPDALNAQHLNGRCSADSDQEPQYSPEAAGWAAAYKPRGTEQDTPAGSPASHLQTKSQCRERVLQHSPCRWQLQALQSGFCSMACITGVLNPNNQYNIYWIKYGHLSKISFLSSSYPQTQPLVPSSKSAPNQISSTVLLPHIGRLNFPLVQPLFCPLLEWWCAGVQIPQDQVVDILEFAATKNVPVSVGQTSFVQPSK